MKAKVITWVKDGIEIKQIVPECSCGGRAKLIGSAGCSHSEEYTYTYQCLDCKTIVMLDGVYGHNSENTEEFIKGGWKEIK